MANSYKKTKPAFRPNPKRVAAVAKKVQKKRVATSVTNGATTTFENTLTNKAIPSPYAFHPYLALLVGSDSGLQKCYPDPRNRTTSTCTDHTSRPSSFTIIGGCNIDSNVDSYDVATIKICDTCYAIVAS